MRNIVVVALLCVFAVSITSFAAGIPKLINYQGMLTDDEGTPLNGTHSITFKIYNAETEGIQRWIETQSSVSITNGLFNVILGSVAPINLDFSEDYWLEITVGDEQMPSRLKFTSVGYAYRAAVADSAAKAGLTGGGWTDDSTVVRLNTITDKVGIGTTSAMAKFHSEGSWILGITNSVLPIHWGYGFTGWLTSHKGILYEGAGDSTAHVFATYGTGDIVQFGKSTSQGEQIKACFVINNNENVGIGTKTPGTKLAVAGLTGTSSYSPVRVNTATGDFYFETSSERYKLQICPLEVEFDKILKAEPKSYIDKTSGQTEIGYIAEEFDDLGLKNLVIYDKDGQPDGLKYERLSLYILEVAKKLKTENEELRKRIELLEGK